MMSIKAVMQGPENIVRAGDASTAFGEAPTSGVVCPAEGAGARHDEASQPPSEPAPKRPLAAPSAPSDTEGDAEEYEEVEELMYERTGTLAFPNPALIIESAARAAEAVGARPEKHERPAVGSVSWSSVARLMRDLRSLSEGTPGVGLAATVDVAPSAAARPPERREPAPPAPVAAPRAEAPASTREPASAAAAAASRAMLAPLYVQSPVVVAPAAPPPRRRSTVASRAISKVVQPSIALVPPAARPRAPRPAVDARSLAVVPSAERTTKPSLRVRSQVLRGYPSFGQRVLAEVRRIPLAKRSLAVGALAAVLVAGMFVAYSALASKRAPRQAAAARSVERAGAAQRAPAPAASVVTSAAPRAPAAAGERAPELALAGEREPAPSVEPRVSVWAEETAGDATAPVRAPAAAPLTRHHVARGKAAPAASRPVSTPLAAPPCACLPGDPLCGCLD